MIAQVACDHAAPNRPEPSGKVPRREVRLIQASASLTLPLNGPTSPQERPANSLTSHGHVETFFRADQVIVVVVADVELNPLDRRVEAALGNLDILRLRSARLDADIERLVERERAQGRGIDPAFTTFSPPM